MKQMTADNRTVIDRWEDAHLNFEFLKYQHLPPGMATAFRREGYELAYQRLGPSVLRMWRIYLRGYMHLRDSPEPVLRARADRLLRELDQACPAILPVKFLGPNEQVRRLASETLDTYSREVGRLGFKSWFLGAGATGWIWLRGLRLRYFGKPQRQPIPVRVTYPARAPFR
jgi:hypothetical protein